MPEDRVNVNAGAIALGHPIGASGTRILTTLLYEMARRDVELGIAAMCIGDGQGIAMVVDRAKHLLERLTSAECRCRWRDGRRRTLRRPNSGSAATGGTFGASQVTNGHGPVRATSVYWNPTDSRGVNP
jgi:hypothetical protein